MYVIPPPGSEQLKHVDQQGHEELEAHDKTAFQTAATAAAAVVAQVGCEPYCFASVGSQPSDKDMAYMRREIKQQLLKKMIQHHHLQLQLHGRSSRSCLQPKWVQCIQLPCFCAV